MDTLAIEQTLVAHIPDIAIRCPHLVQAMVDYAPTNERYDGLVRGQTDVERILSSDLARTVLLLHEAARNPVMSDVLDELMATSGSRYDRAISHTGRDVWMALCLAWPPQLAWGANPPDVDGAKTSVAQYLQARGAHATSRRDEDGDTLWTYLLLYSMCHTPGFVGVLLDAAQHNTDLHDELMRQKCGDIVTSAAGSEQRTQTRRLVRSAQEKFVLQTALGDVAKARTPRVM